MTESKNIKDRLIFQPLSLDAPKEKPPLDEAPSLEKLFQFELNTNFGKISHALVQRSLSNTGHFSLDVRFHEDPLLDMEVWKTLSEIIDEFDNEHLLGLNGEQFAHLSDDKVRKKHLLLIEQAAVRIQEYCLGEFDTLPDYLKGNKMKWINCTPKPGKYKKPQNFSADYGFFRLEKPQQEAISRAYSIAIINALLLTAKSKKLNPPKSTIEILIESPSLIGHLPSHISSELSITTKPRGIEQLIDKERDFSKQYYTALKHLREKEGIKLRPPLDKDYVESILDYSPPAVHSMKMRDQFQDPKVRMLLKKYLGDIPLEYNDVLEEIFKLPMEGKKSFSKLLDDLKEIKIFDRYQLSSILPISWRISLFARNLSYLITVEQTKRTRVSSSLTTRPDIINVNVEGVDPEDIRKSLKIKDERNTGGIVNPENELIGNQLLAFYFDFSNWLKEKGRKDSIDYEKQMREAWIDFISDKSLPFEGNYKKNRELVKIRRVLRELINEYEKEHPTKTHPKIKATFSELKFGYNPDTFITDVVEKEYYRHYMLLLQIFGRTRKMDQSFEKWLKDSPIMYYFFIPEILKLNSVIIKMFGGTNKAKRVISDVNFTDDFPMLLRVGRNSNYWYGLLKCHRNIKGLVTSALNIRKDEDSDIEFEFN